MNTVTIGLPVYNAEPFLADAIRSVLAQTYPDWELIVVDDGSTDRPLEIARRIEGGRVRVVAGGRKLGLAPRLNQIRDLANGRLLARMDTDDLMHPERLARQVVDQFLNRVREQHVPGLEKVASGHESIELRAAL